MLKVFTQDNCPTCKKLKDVLKDSTLKYELINKELKNKESFLKYNVASAPVAILVDDNQDEIDRFYGAKGLNEIESFLKGAY